jgi:hypothetical protein
MLTTFTEVVVVLRLLGLGIHGVGRCDVGALPSLRRNLGREMETGNL